MVRLPRELEALGRMLTYIFCHRPDEFGLVLAEDGSLEVKHLLQALVLEPGWGYVRRRHLEEVAALMQPARFELVGERFRCLMPVARLRRPVLESLPPLLYFGLAPKAHTRVWEEGLKAPAGRELLLARRPELALKLAKRRSPGPILITVQAQAARRKGVVFEGYGEELFLAVEVPREFLQMPAPPVMPEKARSSRVVPVQPSAGSIIMDLPQFFQGTMGISEEKAARGRKYAQRTAGKERKVSKKRGGR